MVRVFCATLWTVTLCCYSILVAKYTPVSLLCLRPHKLVIKESSFFTDSLFDDSVKRCHIAVLAWNDDSNKSFKVKFHCLSTTAINTKRSLYILWLNLLFCCIYATMSHVQLPNKHETASHWWKDSSVKCVDGDVKPSATLTHSVTPSYRILSYFYAWLLTILSV